MTTKEKAINLYQKYLPQCIGYNGFFDKTKVDEDTSGKAKLCALINCDEIIETAMTGYLLNDQSVSEFQIKMRDYWQQVKIEITNL